jgi:hypothetical protein
MSKCWPSTNPPLPSPRLEPPRPTRSFRAAWTSARVAAEDFALQAAEPPYDLVFAVRIGVLGGRHPMTGEQVLQRIALATRAGARLVIDGGNPLRELPIPRP